MRLARAVILAALVLASAVLVGGAPASAATEICEQYGSVRVDGGRYIVQNNRWGASTAQCISVDGPSFRITRADHNNPTNGPPASYPSIYAGCHYANCTTGSGLPVRVNALANPRGTYAISTAPGEWNASFDLWFDPTPRTDGQNTGAELMIWANYQGRPQPIGSPVGTVNLEGGTWEVWIGNIGWNVISFRRTQPTTLMDNFSVKAFVDEGVRRGQINPNWFMTSVQAGFEPWVGGAGLAVNRFAFTLNGGGGGGGTTTIVGQGSNRCVDVSGGRTTDGTVIHLWDCLNNPAQQWRRTGNTLVNPNSGKCLDVRGQGTTNGTQVWLWTCLNNPAQQWETRPNGTIVNPHSGKCLDAVERGTTNGTRLQIWECGTPQPNQLWRLT